MLNKSLHFVLHLLRKRGNGNNSQIRYLEGNKNFGIRISKIVF